MYQYMRIQGREKTNFVGTIVYEDDWQIAVSVQDGKMV